MGIPGLGRLRIPAFLRGGRRKPTIGAQTWQRPDGVTVIDVRGQTCPGYLLAINQAMDRLSPGTEAELLIDYPPCGDDVEAWCQARGHTFLEVLPSTGLWTIRVRK